MRKHSTFVPTEVRYLWGTYRPEESTNATCEWLAFLEAMTVSGVLQLPYGSYLA